MANPARDIVHPTDPDINEMIGMPKQLETADGRRFTIQRWSPTIDFEQGIVTIETVLVLRRLPIAKMDVDHVAYRGIDVSGIVNGGTKVKAILAARNETADCELTMGERGFRDGLLGRDIGEFTGTTAENAAYARGWLNGTKAKSELGSVS